VNADEPITLKHACELFPAARLTVSTLRSAADRGMLLIFPIGRRYYTTPADMAEWINKCREEGRRRGFGSIAAEANGSSETEQLSSAQAAASNTVEMLKRLSKPTSPGSTSRKLAPRRSSTMS
jgi:hypothetical protein